MNGKSFTKLFKVLGVLLLVWAICNLTSVHAEVPKLINFEGKLTEKDGTPISGKRTITFRIYDSEAAPIPIIWAETREVTIDNGFYSILLGSPDGFPSSMKFDTTYWLSVQVSGEAEMSPRYKIGAVPYAINADMLDGKDSKELIPPGVIVMWSGTIDSIPEGWHLCDGRDKTPDLRDRFILGVSAEEEPGGTGGAHSKVITVANLPLHSHSASSASAGDHRHYLTMNACSEGWGANGVRGFEPPTDYYVHFWTDSAGAHSHTITVNATGGGQSFDNRPAFYKLAYIMKL